MFCNALLQLAIPSHHASSLRDPPLPCCPSRWQLRCRLDNTSRTRACASVDRTKAAPGSIRLLPTDLGGNHHENPHRAPYNYILHNLDGIPEPGSIVSTRTDLSSVGTHYLLRFAGYQPYPSGYVVISCKKWLTLTIPEGRYFRSSDHQQRTQTHTHTHTHTHCESRQVMGSDAG